MTPVPEGMKESEHTAPRDRLLLYYLVRTFVGSNSSYVPGWPQAEKKADRIDHSFSTYLLSTYVLSPCKKLRTG